MIMAKINAFPPTAFFFFVIFSSPSLPAGMVTHTLCTQNTNRTLYYLQQLVLQALGLLKGLFVSQCHGGEGLLG